MAANNYPPDLDALISLLDDPDIEAFQHVKERIARLGPVAVPPLEAAWETSYDPVKQKRIEELVHQIQMGQVFDEFIEWVRDGCRDLLKGYLLITRFQYPDLDESKIIAQVDQIVRDIWLELNNNLTSLEKVKVLNHILFQVHNFIGFITTKPSPEIIYLNNMLESKKGNPLSLGLLYLIAGQRLGIPMQGIDLPEHFIIAYTNQVMDDTISGHDSVDVQFYINPFAKGAVFSQSELGEYLKQIDADPDENYYLPNTHIQITRRLLKDLIDTYRYLKKESKARELKRFLNALNLLREE